MLQPVAFDERLHGSQVGERWQHDDLGLLGSCFLSSRVQASFWTRPTASTWLRFIFQLPAISGLRAIVLDLSVEYGQARESLALQIFQAGTAAGRDMTELVVGEAKITNRGCRIATADHRQTIDLGEGPRYGLGARGEALPFRDAHGPVPEDRLRVGDHSAEHSSRVRADVQAELIGGIVSAGTTEASASGANSGATTMSEGSRIRLPPDAAALR